MCDIWLCGQEPSTLFFKLWLGGKPYLHVLQTIPTKDFAHNLHDSGQTHSLPEVDFIFLFKYKSNGVFAFDFF